MPSTVIQDVQSGQFVARRVDLVFNVAKSLYTRVESASPAIVKKSVEALDKQTEWLSRPLVSKLSAVSQPVIARLDTGLASAYTQLDSRVLKPSQKLQEDLKVKVAEKVPAVPDFNTFYSAAVDALHSVAESARAKAATTSVSFEDFAAALKARLALPAQLEEALLTPAVTFYLEASTRLSGMKASAGGVLAPAIEYYRAHKDLSVPQLLEGYKAQMGSLWNDRLAQPLTILFNNMRQTASEDIRRLQTSAESQRALVAQQWTQLLSLSASAIDTYLPEPAEPADKPTESSEPVPLSVAVLASRVTRRLRTRASTLSARAGTQLQTVRTLAPERVKSYLPADLIAYANNLLERVDNAYHPTQRVEQVRAACIHSVAYGQEVCKHAVTAFESRVSHLRTGVSSALIRFKSVVQTGIDQVNVEEVKNVQRDLSLLCIKTLRREESNAELRQLQTDAAALYKRMSFALKTLITSRQQLANPPKAVETEAASEEQ